MYGNITFEFLKFYSHYLWKKILVHTFTSNESRSHHVTASHCGTAVSITRNSCVSLSNISLKHT